MKKAFSFIPIPTRPSKPRQKGLTMMIDWGLGTTSQDDILKVIHEFVDLAKFAVGISGLMDIEVLKEKIEIYKRYQIEPFIGGQFLEFAIHHKGLDVAKSYFDHAREIGFKAIEVSDNTLRIDPKDKFNLVKLAREEFNLKVLGEVGSKLESSSINAMVDGIEGCIEAGAWKVLLEGAEFVEKESGGLIKEVVESIASRIDMDKLFFELPGIWVPHVHYAEIHEMTVHLVKTFGLNVNIANVMPDWVLELETLRTGVGVLGV